jgi:hypothetical protein
MKKPTKKLTLTTTTIRDLQTTELADVVGGSVSVYNPSGGRIVMTPSTVILPSGGITSFNPSGGSRH